ncbi:hypothetical protein ACHQM5_005585 [Ranunculus cassubicifolius]
MAPTEQVRSPEPPYRGPGKGSNIKYSLYKGDDFSKVFHHVFKFKGDNFIIDGNKEIHDVNDPKHKDLLECLRDMKCPEDYADGKHVFAVSGYYESRDFFPQPYVTRYLDPRNITV